MFEHWQFQEAKNKLSEVVNMALRKGAQIITRRGEEVAVVLSYSDYQKLQISNSNLADFFRNSPLSGCNFETSTLRSLLIEKK